MRSRRKRERIGKAGDGGRSRWRRSVVEIMILIVLMKRNFIGREEEID
jgi:hypothetical protein